MVMSRTPPFSHSKRGPSQDPIVSPDSSTVVLVFLIATEVLIGFED